ncbi:MAG: hypothetical protein KC505_01820 [Myxococcales bacterium]|nr:hypothetical protein [Myxococcales bacterium]USN51956.1 MAG: hypothetical protein H6731_07290 [Myxococcales bacterium]
MLRVTLPKKSAKDETIKINVA